MILDVVLEWLCANDIFVVAPIGKRQNCSAFPGLAVRNKYQAVRIVNQVGTWSCPSVICDSLIGAASLQNTSICLCRDQMGVVFYSVKVSLKGVGNRTVVQRLVRVRMTKCSVRRMIPWKHYIEHANEGSSIYITNIANRDLIVDPFWRLWIPQRNPLRQGCELVPVNVEGWIY